jgi:hypothetical protein
MVSAVPRAQASLAAQRSASSLPGDPSYPAMIPSVIPVMATLLAYWT